MMLTVNLVKDKVELCLVAWQEHDAAHHSHVEGYVDFRASLALAKYLVTLTLTLTLRVTVGLRITPVLLRVGVRVRVRAQNYPSTD